MEQAIVGATDKDSGCAWWDVVIFREMCVVVKEGGQDKEEDVVLFVWRFYKGGQTTPDDKSAFQQRDIVASLWEDILPEDYGW